jgi:hypothetical protein
MLSARLFSATLSEFLNDRAQIIDRRLHSAGVAAEVVRLGIEPRLEYSHQFDLSKYSALND